MLTNSTSTNQEVSTVAADGSIISPQRSAFRYSRGSKQAPADSPVVVVFAADDGYALPLGVALFSLIENLDRNISAAIFILGIDMSADSKKRLNAVLQRAGPNVTHSVIDVDDDLVSHLRIRSYVTSAAYLRLFMPYILPERFRKAIYLDCDVLVQRDISDLWNCDMDGKLLLAATAYGANRASDPGHVHNWLELGIPQDAYYFNSGVMVIDLEQWRDRDLTPPLVDYVIKHKDTMNYHDQGTLNAVCFDSWGPLDPTWNVMIYKSVDPSKWPPSILRDQLIGRWKDIWSSPAICHFTTQWKPWTPGHRSHMQKVWLSAFRRSGWYSRIEYSEWFLKWNMTHYCRGITRKLLGRNTNDRQLARPIRLWSECLKTRLSKP
jgi:lipopolysaccharide biosynthesis glycosyltransferase